MDDQHTKFAALTGDAIKAFALSQGYDNISENMCALLAEDVSYRVRQIVQLSSQFMRHGKRKCLLAADVNKALELFGCQMVYGAGTKPPLRLSQISESAEEPDVYFLDDNEVDLSLKLSHATSTSEENGNNGIEAQLATTWVGIEKSLKDLDSDSGDNFVYKEYYEAMTSAILGPDKASMQKALTDIRSNKHLSSLLPHFADFVSSGIRLYYLLSLTELHYLYRLQCTSWWGISFRRFPVFLHVRRTSHDVLQLERLLECVRALLSNPHICLRPKPYVGQLEDSLQFCMLEPLVSSLSHPEDHWTLREHAAELMARLERRWPHSYDGNAMLDNYNPFLNKYTCLLRDSTRPSGTHYGALMAIRTLGPEVILHVLLPIFDQVIDNVRVLQESKNHNTRNDGHFLNSVLLSCCVILFRWAVKRLLEEDSEISKVQSSRHHLSLQAHHTAEIAHETLHMRKHSTGPTCAIENQFDLRKWYLKFVQTFGDAFTLLLLPVALECTAFHGAVTREKAERVILADPGLETQTGEELTENLLKENQLSQRDVALANEPAAPLRGSDVMPKLAVKRTEDTLAGGIKITISKRRFAGAEVTADQNESPSGLHSGHLAGTASPNSVQMHGLSNRSPNRKKIRLLSSEPQMSASTPARTSRKLDVCQVFDRAEVSQLTPEERMRDGGKGLLGAASVVQGSKKTTPEVVKFCFVFGGQEPKHCYFQRKRPSVGTFTDQTELTQQTSSGAKSSFYILTRGLSPIGKLRKPSTKNKSLGLVGKVVNGTTQRSLDFVETTFISL